MLLFAYLFLFLTQSHIPEVSNYKGMLSPHNKVKGGPGVYHVVHLLFIFAMRELTLILRGQKEGNAQRRLSVVSWFELRPDLKNKKQLIFP